MTPSKIKLLVWPLVGLLYAIMMATFFLIWLDRSAAVPDGYDPGSLLVWTGTFATVPLVGGVIAARQPRNPYGWIWLAFGSAFIWMNLCQAYTTHALVVDPGSLPLARPMLLTGGLSWLVGFAMLPFLILYFPTGRLPSPRWRFVVWLTAAALACGVMVGWALPGQSGIAPIDNPYGLEGDLGQAVVLFVDIAVFTIFAATLLGALSLALRYRAASGVVRQQLKWFAFGAIFIVVFLISDFFIELPGIWESIKEMVSFTVLPVAVGIAILRYRLYDIDVIIRKTLLYGALTLLLGLIYFGNVVVLQSLFTAISGQQSAVALVLSTLLIAALFNPLRGRVKALIDRRFYRRKYDAQQVQAQFAKSVRDEVDVDTLTAELLKVVQETLQPVQASIWLRQSSNSSSNGIPRANAIGRKAENESLPWRISQK